MFDTIFFVGRSGAGKGTQARKLAERAGFFYWEMGAILRSEIARGTEIGKQIADLVNRGLFLDDHHMLQAIANHLDEIPKDKGIIFDGVPRRLSQAYYIMGLLRGMGRKQMGTIHLDVSRSVSLERLSLRAKVENRADDTQEAILRRLDQFEIETVPVIEYLKQQTKYFLIDGMPSMEWVEKEIDTALGL